MIKMLTRRAIIKSLELAGMISKEDQIKLADEIEKSEENINNPITENDIVKIVAKITEGRIK